MHPHGAADAQRKHEVSGFVGLILTERYSPPSICYGGLQAEGSGGRKSFISKYSPFQRPPRAITPFAD